MAAKEKIMHAWYELTKKPPQQLTDGERVAIVSVIKRSVSDRCNFTMEKIFQELIGEYNHLFAHCDPFPRGENVKENQQSASNQDRESIEASDEILSQTSNLETQK